MKAVIGALRDVARSLRSPFLRWLVWEEIKRGFSWEGNR